MNKLLSLFKKKQKLISKGVYDRFVYSNNHIDIVHDSCKICYDIKKETDIQAKLDYIGRRVKTGHESVLEHSNVILYFVFENNTDNLQALTEVVDLCSYLRIKTKYIKNEVHFLIGGSIRGYKHIFRNIENQDNHIAKLILNNLYRTNKEYFTDFIEDNIMEEYKFNDLEYLYPTIITNKILNPNITIVNMDDIVNIYDELYGIFTIEELLDFCTITIFFQNMSRIISQQVTRHRNAITQLSQRYVNYSSGKFLFNSPALYNQSYDPNHKYTVDFNNVIGEYTLEELGDEIMKIYNQLVDKSLGDHRLKPEDARAYLPNNAQTSLYMTFTFKNLIKFLQLRTDKHAQSEIRLLANAIESNIKPILDEVLGKDMYEVLEPKYKVLQTNEDLYSEIDEIIE